MAHALAGFIQQQMEERRLRNRDVEAASGLSRQLVSKYAHDSRARLTRLPDKETLAGFARALRVSPEFLLAKAVESLDLGYTAGDFVNQVGSASDAELLEEIQRRLDERGGEHADSSASTNGPEGPADQPIDLTTRKGEKVKESVTKLSEQGSTLDHSEPRVAKKRSPKKRPD